MGGLRKSMPMTHVFFLIACLAIAGLPPLSGFFSKEMILYAAFQTNRLVFALAILTSALTAFYMFRLYFSVFWSSEREKVFHSSEGTVSMKLPMLLLSGCAMLAGFVPFSEFITKDGRPATGHFDIYFAIAPFVLALAGIMTASLFYKKQNDRPQKVSQSLGWFYRTAKRKFYIDEAWLFITDKIFFKAIVRPAAWFDRTIVDGMMNGIAYLTASTSQIIKGVQSGRVQSYALYFFYGIAALAIIFIYFRKS